MDVYLMGIAYCPLIKAEQDSNSCLACKNFAGFEVNTGRSKLESRSMLYIQCTYTGKSRGIYQSSKTKQQATWIDGEDAPPLHTEDEVWQKVSK